MELKWLEDFTCLAKTGSFSRASDERNVTQPAFSRRIRALEDWLGATLIDRSSYPVCLTPHGEKFLPYAQDILKSANGVRDDFRLIKNFQVDIVRIVTLHTLSMSFIPDLAQKVLQKEPDLKIEVIANIQGVDQHVDALVNGVVDMMITYWHDAVGVDPANLGGFEKKNLGRDSLIPVASARFAKRRKLKNIWQAKDPIPFLAYSNFSFSNRIVEPLIAELGDRLQVVYENALSESLKAMVVRDCGVAWLPRSTVQPALDSGDVIFVGGEDDSITLDIVAYKRQADTDGPIGAVWNLF
jgi:DNA-binding transcriptional LysR family regulator